MTEQRFRAMLQNRRDTLSSKQQFIGLLKDYFPSEPMIVNLMVQLHEMGIFTAIEETDCASKDFKYQFVQRLVNEQGVNRQHAESLVDLVCVCYGKEILGKPCDLGRLEGRGAEAKSLAPISARPLQQRTTAPPSSDQPLYEYPYLQTSEILKKKNGFVGVQGGMTGFLIQSAADLMIRKYQYSPDVPQRKTVKNWIALHDFEQIYNWKVLGKSPVIEWDGKKLSVKIIYDIVSACPSQPLYVGIGGGLNALEQMGKEEIKAIPRQLLTAKEAPNRNWVKGSDFRKLLDRKGVF